MYACVGDTVMERENVRVCETARERESERERERERESKQATERERNLHQQDAPTLAQCDTKKKRKKTYTNKMR